MFIQLSINGWFGHLAVAPACLNHVYIAISDRDARPVSLSTLSNAEINVIRRRKEIRRGINSTLEILSISAYYCTHCDLFRFCIESYENIRDETIVIFSIFLIQSMIFFSKEKFEREI